MEGRRRRGGRVEAGEGNDTRKNEVKDLTHSGRRFWSTKTAQEGNVADCSKITAHAAQRDWQRILLR